MRKIFKNRSGVTLLELLIVIGIIAILSVILFRTFGSISEIAFRIQQENNVTQEVIWFSQIIQNYADRNTIDYQKYHEGTGDSLLVVNTWIVDVLYLSWADGQLAIYSSGDCIQPEEVPLSWLVDRECALYLDKNWQEIQLTNPKKIYLSKMLFKIIPFASQEQYLAQPELCDTPESLLFCLNSPWFWIIAQGYNPRYSEARWWNHVQLPVQQFFNLK